MKLTGIVTDGYQKGAEVHIDLHGGQRGATIRIVQE